MGVGGKCHVPATFPPGKTQYPLYRRLGGPKAGLDGCGKSRPQRHTTVRQTFLTFRGPCILIYSYNKSQ